MARTEYGVPQPGDIRSYFYLTTDNAETYPTAAECGAGSTIMLVDGTTHAITGTLIFDGTNWNTI